MKTRKRMYALVMVIAVVLAMLTPVTADAATKIKLSKTNVTLTMTDKKPNPAVTLKVAGASKKAVKKAKWTTSNKKVATVKDGKVTAKAAGKATITCKVSGKKLACKITVKDKRAGLNVTIRSERKSILDIKPFHNIIVTTNQAVVTYNGKDVSNKTYYELWEVGDKNQAYCFDNGYITEVGDKYGMCKLKGNYTLIVTYKDMKKVLNLKLDTERLFYYTCSGCDKVFDSRDALMEHQHENFAAYRRGEVNDWICSGHIISDYYATTVTVVK